MAVGSLQIVPGTNVEKTLSQNQTGVSASSNVRWREGMAEKRGGWAKFINTVFSGTPRALHAWEDLNQGRNLAVGTTSNLYVVANGASSDVSIESRTVSVAVKVDTTITSTTVTIYDTGRNATIYDAVLINTPVAVGGIVLFGAYQVSQAVGADAYDIIAASAATATVSGGGAVATFTTTNTQAAVTVTLPNHGYGPGEIFPVLISTSVGGVTLFGQYEISSVTSSSAFVINAANAATSSATASMNGGNVSLTYYVAVGPSVLGTGYGIGGYGSGGYGTGSTSSATTAPKITASDYWLDNWGEILLANPVGGPIFTWSRDSGYANMAIIPQAPTANAGLFVAMPEQQIVAWGSTYTGISDPLQIRWCDSSDFTVWVADATNQAGGYRIPTGSQIVSGMQASGQLMFWTDIDLYIAQYVGSEFVWGFDKKSTGCGLIAPKAAVQIGSAVYWMSQKQFFVYGAQGAMPMDCPVWDAVFQNLNPAFIANIRAGANSQFNEVSWDYPSAQSVSGENDMRVVFNVVEKEWDVFPINRSAWIDQSVLGAPIGSSSAGVVYQHEISPDGDGVPLVASLTTGYFGLGDAEDVMFVSTIMPDMKWGTYSGAQNASVQITFNVVDYVGDAPTTYGPFTVTHATQYFEPRFRGRFAQMVIGSMDAGSFWRVGRIRYRYAPDGRV